MYILINLVEKISSADFQFLRNDNKKEKTAQPNYNLSLFTAHCLLITAQCFIPSLTSIIIALLAG
jgi:hypothetical protein